LRPGVQVAVSQRGLALNGQEVDKAELLGQRALTVLQIIDTTVSNDAWNSAVAAVKAAVTGLIKLKLPLTTLHWLLLDNVKGPANALYLQVLQMSDRRVVLRRCVLLHCIAPSPQYDVMRCVGPRAKLQWCFVTAASCIHSYSWLCVANSSTC
jgi:hypothetical protein